MGKFHEEKRKRQAQIKYEYTNEQIEAIRAQAMHDGCAESFNILLGLTCLVLHNSFRFGKGRCTVVCERILSMFERMNTPGGLTLDQIDKAAFELGGVKSILLKRERKI